jgi:hypothetical protein
MRDVRFTYDGEDSLIMSATLMAKCVENIQEFEGCNFENAYYNLMDSPAYEEFFEDDCWYMDCADPFHDYRYYKYHDVCL